VPLRLEVGVTDRLARFRALPEAEGRVLLLIDAFSGTADKPRVLEGRLKLAKLDFLVRYPKYLARVLRGRNVSEKVIASIGEEPAPLQDRMIRYRYGPWDPSYFAVLGSLIGRGLVDPIPFSKGIGYRVTERGRELAGALVGDDTWTPVHQRAVAARRHLDLSGTKLKDLLYDAIPEMTNAEWHAEVE
jgi:hypothetical protein